MSFDSYINKSQYVLRSCIKTEYRKWRIGLKKVKKYPRVLQLPITHLCNFDCVMCGMHHMIHRRDFTSEELGIILEDRLYKNVEVVGLNGGEPFLKSDIVECINVIVEKLPKLKELNIISNGFYTDRIVEVLKAVTSIRKEHSIRMIISFSVDGIYEMQDFHRGHQDSFKNVCLTIDKILLEKERYVDELGIICTITKHNIFRINEVDVWAKKLGINISYNIATVNSRIENADREMDFSVFSDEKAKMLTQEFFYSKYLETRSERYFALFLFLRTGIRYDICPCMYNEWITITPDSQIGFCATHSKKLGSGIEKSSYDIVNNNLSYLDYIKENYCQHCSHYIYGLNSEGLRIMHKNNIENTFMR